MAFGPCGFESRRPYQTASGGLRNMAETEGVQTVAEAYLTLLKARGIDWLFANAGTDFAPIIEALCRGATAGLAMPEALAAPHETVAVGMAHGYYLACGRPQAVMVHVNVGMANALMGLLNAARDAVPILFTSGRTPVTEAGRLGSRDLPIHWGQEMRDQGGMLREYVKWDYELRYGEQLEPIVDRALAIAMTPPAGPVYLSLPREALAAPIADFDYSPSPRLRAPAAPAPAPQAIAEAAAILARAERPLIIGGRGDGTERGFEALARFALRFAIPVVEFWPSRLSLATDHPMHMGFDVMPWLSESDAVLVLDAMVPWLPQRHPLPESCPVIQVGPDPLFSDLPMRSFPATVAITAATGDAITALADALAAERPGAWLDDAPAADRGAQSRAPAGARGRGRGRPRRADEPGLDQPLRRARQGRRRDAVQRARLPARRSSPSPGPTATSATRSPAGSAGGCRRRSAPSSPAPSAW